MRQDIFQSLWIGRRLSAMEVLSIRSFLSFGYEYHLYCYNAVENVPAGVTLCDAGEILPPGEIFAYRHGFGKGSPAGFSDMFRYKLLMERGNWWVDTDVVCVRPFEFAAEHVCGRERSPQGMGINGAVIRAPAGSPLAGHCYEQCLRIDRRSIRWGEIGPLLLQQAIDTLEMADCVQPPDVFYPVDYWRIHHLFEDRPLPSDSRAVHLWHAIWRSRGIDPGGVFPPECTYEQLRRRFLADHRPPLLSDEELQRVRAELSKALAPRRPHYLKRLRDRLRSLLPGAKAA